MGSDKRNMRLCDTDGCVTGAYLIQWTSLEWRLAGRIYTGGAFVCTGGAHLGNTEITCTSPAHRATVPVLSIPGMKAVPDLSMVALQLRELDDLLSRVNSALGAEARERVLALALMFDIDLKRGT